MFESLAEIAWHNSFIYAGLASFLTFLIVSLRYKILLTYFGEKISILNSFFIITSTQFFSYLFPFKIGSIVIKPMLTSFFAKIAVPKSFFASVFEQVFEIIWQIVLLLILLLWIGEKVMLKQITSQLVFVTVILIIFFALVINYRRIIKYLWSLRIFVPKNLKKAAKHLKLTKETLKNTFDTAFHHLFKLDLVVMMTSINLVFTLVSPLALYFVALPFGGIPYTGALIVYWVSVIIGRLSGLPGGIASREAVMTGLLVAYHVSPLDAVTISILTRVMLLIPLFVVGAPISLSKGLNIKKLIK